MSKEMDRECIARLLRYLRMGKPRHHVTVHSNGRCLLRAPAVKRFRLSSFVSVSVTMRETEALLVFYADNSGSSRLIHPVRSNGTVCSCLYFYSRKIATCAASSGTSRFRLAAKGERDNKGSFRILLKLEEVKDLYGRLNELKIQSHGKTNRL